MDAAHIFRQGLGTVAPRHAQPLFQEQLRRPAPRRDELSDGEVGGARVAHTLTACCRCRQRKTRCDPTLPRCLPCERSGSVCEYLDTTKGRKMSRYYVVRLQDNVRALEDELSQYTDDDGDYPRTNEDIVRPGGMVRLNGSDETPRYLGPSSGVAMTRLLMEQAKKYTDSSRISELIPQIRARRQARMQSIQMAGSAGRRKSYPMMSERPAESLPTRAVAEKLVEMFNQKAQNFWPALHEKDFRADMESVYNGDQEPHKNFILRMVFAISLQKLDTQYAGLADSYYLAAMQQFQDVIRPKDLKTLQCLVLLVQYSLLTPTRTPVYYVIGLATRICQQEGLTDEQTIKTGYNLDPKTIDMRRRLVWIVNAMELGLSHSMGRPSGFATGVDRLDVEFFATVDDEHITEHGINTSAPISDRKVAAIHFYRMRIHQAEIRHCLYEKKRQQPKTDIHPWFEETEGKLKTWLDSSPTSPPWCMPWFTGRYHQLKVFMYRPSPQIPKPSPRAANICFESSAFVINISQQQMTGGGHDITWVFLLTLNMSLNTILWATAYPEVRRNHPRHEVEELINTSLDVLDQCAERWPGTSSASQLYAIFSKACLQSYDSQDEDGPPSANSLQSLSEVTESHMSPLDFPPGQADPKQNSLFNPPNFGYVFDSSHEAMNAYTFDPNYPPPQPSFRSNSIFRNPATTDSSGRRFSYFPPDGMQMGETAPEDAALSLASPESALASPPDQISSQLPSPPESMNLSATASNSTLSPPMIQPSIATVVNANNTPRALANPSVFSQSQKQLPNQNQNQMFNVTQAPQNHQLAPAQRPLPPASGIADWFTPNQPFISPYSFGSLNNNFVNDGMANANPFGQMQGMVGGGLADLGGGGATDMGLGQFTFPTERHGSLTHSQQLELMNVLETEGVGDIDAFLSAGNSLNNARFY